MADAVTTKTVFESPNRLVVHLTNDSDGTGESGVTKVDKSTHTGPNGLEPTHLAIDKIVYDVSSMKVALAWDHTADETIAILQGDGCIDFSRGGRHAYLIDSNSGATGDIILTTENQASGDGYDITLHLRKKN